MQLFASNVYILYRHITYNMASQINTPTTFLPSVLPSGIGGNAADYQAKIMGGAQRRGAQRKGAQRKGAQRKGAQQQQNGGQGYGFEGKEIAPGKMEFSSYKGGSKKRRHSKKRRQQRKSKRQQKSRRR